MQNILSSCVIYKYPPPADAKFLLSCCQAEVHPAFSLLNCVKKENSERPRERISRSWSTRYSHTLVLQLMRLPSNQLLSVSGPAEVDSADHLKSSPRGTWWNGRTWGFSFLKLFPLVQTGGRPKWVSPCCCGGKHLLSVSDLRFPIGGLEVYSILECHFCGSSRTLCIDAYLWVEREKGQHRHLCPRDSASRRHLYDDPHWKALARFEWDCVQLGYLWIRHCSGTKTYLWPAGQRTGQIVSSSFHLFIR